MHLNDPKDDSVFFAALNLDIFLITFSNKKVIQNNNKTNDYDMTHHESVTESKQIYLISISEEWNIKF